jgi:predicted DNA-binding transcriptional regulator AlpA
MPEILTVSELASLLKMTESQIFTMTRSRGRQRMAHPLPVLRLNGNLRFRRQDVLDWLDRCAKEEK